MSIGVGCSTCTLDVLIQGVAHAAIFGVGHSIGRRSAMLIAATAGTDLVALPGVSKIK